MRIIFFSFITIALTFSSCKTEKKSLLGTANLPSTFISVDATTDSIFITPKGAAIKIRPGTFNKHVKLEISEAYTMKDILLAGLSTESNGRPLTSGGMIYINSIEGEKVDLLKPISVAIPTYYVDSAMQLFKGELIKKDSINWQPSDTLPYNDLSKSIAAGKQLFQQNCRTCHNLDRDLTGPALRGFTQRGPWKNREEVYKYISYPARYMVGNQYTKDLQKKFGGAVMQAFPALGRKGVNAIIDYLENAAEDPYDDITWKGNILNDSTNPGSICSDTIYYDPTAIRDTSIYNVDTSVFETTDADTNYTVEPDTSYQAGNFQPTPFNTTYTSKSRSYVFEIKTLGWYNVDAFIEGRNGTLLCNLEVKVEPRDFSDVNVYVFFPSYKYLLQGAMDTGHVFSFEKINGKVPLFMQSRGIAIAFGSKDDEIYTGVTSFTVKRQQILNVSLKKSSEEDFIRMIKANNIQGIDLGFKRQQMKVENHPCGKTDAATAVDYQVIY
jgi:mono/diheme cytochrome c family protein